MGDSTENELTAPSLKPPLHNSSAPRDREPDPGDLEKIKKWQEERITRKLKGEYESALLHLSSVVSLLIPLSRDIRKRSTLR